MRFNSLPKKKVVKVDESIERSLFINKKNGQASITIPKKKLLELFPLDKVPRKIRIKIEDVR